jgi:glyoxylase-like metal-dependent hydrolase (beta-lactamase superfamily II)
MIEEILPGIYSIEHRVVEGKNGVILGRRAALAIDGGIDPEEGAAAARFIRERGHVPERLALTHGHGDHVLGAAALAAGEVFAHAATPAVIRRQIPGWAERAGENAEQTAARIVWPTITFTGALRIDLGGHTVRFFPTPGHSEDSVSALVEEAGVLFAGDTVVTGILPAISDGDGRDLEATLRGLAALDIEILVPGHGPILRGRESIREQIRWLADYLARIRAEVHDRVRRGDAPEAILDAVDFDTFVGDRLPADRHGMPRRHRATVAKIVAEERC